MIEFVFDDRCTGCGACVEVCPALVFDSGADRHPVIARQADCQTCYFCELHCQTDALFVASQVGGESGITQDAARPLLGQCRRQSGWHEYAGDPRYSKDHRRMDQVFARARGK